VILARVEKASPGCLEVGDHRLGHFSIVVTVHNPRRLGKGGEHQPVPGSKHLFVATGVHPLLGGFEKLVASLDQGRALVQVAHKLEDILAFKVAAFGNAIGGHESVGF
jgi:hypothetical protein